MTSCLLMLWAAWLVEDAFQPSLDLRARVLHTFKEDKNYVLRSSFSPDGKRLLLLGGERPRLLDIASGKVLARFSPADHGLGGHAYATCGRLLPDGRSALIYYEGRALATVDLTSGKVLRKLDHKDLGYGEAISSDGKLLAVYPPLGQGNRSLTPLFLEVTADKFLPPFELRPPPRMQAVTVVRSFHPMVAPWRLGRTKG